MASLLPIDAATRENARAQLMACCGSEPWVERMLDRRPFGTREALLAAAREEWFALSEPEWRDAFSHHPRIGDRDTLRQRVFSEQEQASVASASDEMLDALADGNREYFDRFGFIFIVCATGLSAERMLELLRSRLQNDPAIEIRVAAEEHARITHLRLLGLA